ncbi:MAG TPA: hydantoinase B/oxoprolinase family protein, partial [Kiloniellaceae bacterium]|nr:hydantoinase B/oxoprolinase family protein [Kiloniellaceae bacterium]
HPARGREGGRPGAAGSVELDDGTVLRPKGWQHVPAGRRLVLQLPGGGGFGDPEARTAKDRAADIAKGYVSSDRS